MFCLLTVSWDAQKETWCLAVLSHFNRASQIQKQGHIKLTIKGINIEYFPLTDLLASVLFFFCVCKELFRAQFTGNTWMNRGTDFRNIPWSFHTALQRRKKTKRGTEMWPYNQTWAECDMHQLMKQNTEETLVSALNQQFRPTPYDRDGESYYHSCLSRNTDAQSACPQNTHNRSLVVYNNSMFLEKRCLVGTHKSIAPETP